MMTEPDGPGAAECVSAGNALAEPIVSGGNARLAASSSGRGLARLAEHKPQPDRLALGQFDRLALRGVGFIAVLVRQCRVDARRHVRPTNTGEPEAVALAQLGYENCPQFSL